MSLGLLKAKLKIKTEKRRSTLALPPDDKLREIGQINKRREKSKYLENLKNCKKHRVGVEVGYGELHEELFEVLEFNGKKRSKNAIIYICESYMVFKASDRTLALANKMRRLTKSDVYFPRYPLAPEYSIRDTVRMLYQTYKEVKKSGYEKVYLYGVGAGATLALEMCVYRNERNVAIDMPDLLVLISPGCAPKDREEWDRMKQYSNKDYSQAPRHLVEVKSLVSYNGFGIPDYMLTCDGLNLTDFPETWFFYSNEEYNFAKYESFKKQFEKAKVDVHFVIRERVPHNYCAERAYPEAYEDYDNIIDMLKS